MFKWISMFLALAFGSMLYAYDAQKADFFHEYYKQFTQKALTDSKLFVAADDVVAMLKSDKRPVLLDIRTEAEASVVGLTLDDAMFIPLERLFEADQLDRIPTERTIVIVCYSGTRAAMAATALHMCGIKNIRVLKGGVAALAKATTPATAPLR